jgi:hypothetical protein
LNSGSKSSDRSLVEGRHDDGLALLLPDRVDDLVLEDACDHVLTLDRPVSLRGRSSGDERLWTTSSPQRRRAVTVRDAQRSGDDGPFDGEVEASQAKLCGERE